MKIGFFFAQENEANLERQREKWSRESKNLNQAFRTARKIKKN
jgi:hypothetical protein